LDDGLGTIRKKQIYSNEDINRKKHTFLTACDLGRILNTVFNVLSVIKPGAPAVFDLPLLIFNQQLYKNPENKLTT
jgi:hypothetical protein